MPEKDPQNYVMLTYLWVTILSLWGGLVNYIRKVKIGEVSRFNLTELIGDLVTSGFVGVLTFMLCESAQLPPLLTAAFVGVSGHMGSRAIFMMEEVIHSLIDKWKSKWITSRK